MKLLFFIFIPLLLMAKEANVEQLFSVQTVKVKSETAMQSKKNYGYVKADDARVHSVVPRFSGYVQKIYADTMYKYVKKGEALITVYSPDVYKAKEDYLNSYNYTLDKKNRGMLNSAKLKLELLEVHPAEIEAIVKKQKVSQETTIYAPISGYVFKKNISQGSAFGAKSELFEIVNLDELWVEMKVFQEQLPWLKKVKSFEVSATGIQGSFEATSSLLYPKVDKKEATLTLRLSLQNRGAKLFPGMYVTILSKSANETQLTLPQSAVIRKTGKLYVFLTTEFKGEYEPKEIVARVEGEKYIIESGLEEGDEVANNAMFMMDSDAQINGLY